jgi:hypothetical protein
MIGLNRSLLVVVLIISTSFALYSADYWVDAQNGLDTNGGTSAQNAFKTITYALSQISPTSENPVTLNCLPGKYDTTLGETFPIYLKSYMTLQGYVASKEQNGQTITIDSTRSDTCAIRSVQEKSIILKNLTVTNCGANNIYGGGIYCNGIEGLTIDNCTISNNTGDIGGGIYLGNCNDTIIRNSSIKSNRAAYGGGIALYYSSPRIIDCSIESNWVEVTNTQTGYGGLGGGINLDYSSPKIENSHFFNNRAVSGGGMKCYYSSPEIFYCSFEENYAELYTDYGGNGGAIDIDNNSGPVIYNTGFINNYAVWGGAIRCTYLATPDINNCYLGNNHVSGGSGGALYAYNCTPTITNCQFSWNLSESNNGNGGIGGGLCFVQIDEKITGCIFDNNRAEHGGGIGIVYSTSQIIGCEIIDNYAEGETQNVGFGGGVYLDQSSSSSLINCLVADNSAYQGGGIYCSDYAYPKITNVTITENQATDGDGIYILNANYVPVLLNSILWDDSVYGAFDADYSVVQGGHDGEGNIDKDPLFAAGPRGNYYLSHKAAGQNADSPCIDAGTTWKISLGFSPYAYTTRTDGIFDKDITDIGYHFQPHVRLGLHIQPEQTFTTGDTLDLLFDVFTPQTTAIPCDVYFVMLDPSGKIFFAPSWNNVPGAVLSNVTLHADMSIGYAQLLSLSIPNTTPPVSAAGQYTFAIGTTKPGTLDFVSNIATVNITVQ